MARVPEVTANVRFPHAQRVDRAEVWTHKTGKWQESRVSNARVVAIVSNDIMTKEISSDLFQNSDREVSIVPTRKLREPVVKCKYLSTCSGATLIGSIVRTSDKRIIRRIKIESFKGNKS